ncbi:hypothetical protein ACIPL1_02295 [Pseudomonas sp. NPDC090202]|uniref:hypothetical protein n=1 Tax=unclassified Pseudomonas TaxID=196821 RepID=UPI003814AD2C
MSVIGKWALQGVVLVLFAWMATVVAQWSSKVVNSTSSDRLAVLSSVHLPSGSMAAGVGKKAQTEAVAVGALSESNE